jgi:hypothetical protein
MKDICGRCRFWEFSHKPEDDLAWGECRRHAPRPTQFLISIIAKNTGGIRWAVEESANVEHENENYYCVETTEQYEVKEWPHVQCDEWCGEFEPAKDRTSLSGFRPDSKERLSEAILWEQEVGLTKE